jgi:hypothetical protein
MAQSLRDVQKRLGGISQYLNRPRPERVVLARRLRKLAAEIEIPVLAMSKVAAMSESEFWKLTEPYGWGTKTKNYKPIKKDLMSKLSPDKADDLNQTFRALTGRLDKALSKVVEGLGDDGYSDLLAHIVGMGKREYERNLKNPQLANERANKYDFAESFSYAIPHKEDYASLDVKRYTGWAQRIVDSYTMVLGADEDDIPWKSKLQGDLKSVIKVMEDFIRTKDVHAFLKEEAEAKAAAERVERILSKLNLGMSIPDEGTLEDAAKSVSNKWFVWNLFTEVRDYMT